MAGLCFQLFCMLLPLLTQVLAAPQNTENIFPRRSGILANASTCRCFPGDNCWPTEAAWNDFNLTLGGKLIATRPIASPCHVDPFEAYNATRCAILQSKWGFPQTHIQTSSSIMAPYFANQSCDPFYPKNAQCVIGSYVQYAVNASEAADYQKTIAFTKKNNIRLTIRNTGHDVNGKSTGAGAVAIWTHYLNSIEFLDYQSSYYTGKAIKMGAGVQVQDADQAAHAQGLVVVGANSPTVGIAGGFTQGGGHGPLASTFGLAADQVLEWEVVTGTGELMTASPRENADLYAALAGGGGGTYGVVLSLTSKAHADQRTAAANLTFSADGISQDKFYDAVETFITNLPQVVDAGAVSIWQLSNTSFSMTPTTAPGLTKAQLHKLLLPAITKLNQSAIKYSTFDNSSPQSMDENVNSNPYLLSTAYIVEDYPTYLDSYTAMNPPTNVSNVQIGGRLIPRSLVEPNSQSLTSALRNINNKGGSVSGFSLNVSQQSGAIPNSIIPAWRDAVFNAVVET